MPRLLSYMSLIAIICLSAPSRASALDKDKIKKDFDAWHTKTVADFEETWTGIMAAEASAMPLYEKGKKQAEAGKKKKAVKTLLAARAKLFNGPKGELVHINKGLSFKIAAALAELYETLEDEPRLKREITFMDVGRPWLSKEKEQQIFVRHAIREVYRVYGIEEYKSGKRMKTKDRKRLYRIMSYAVVGTSDVIFEEGYKQGKAWEATFEEAKKTYAKEEFEDYGGQGGVSAHDHIMAPSESNFKTGAVVLIINREVTKVTNKSIIFDFTKQRLHAVNCKDTGKVRRVTRRGRYVYKQKCDFMARSGGHRLVVKPVKGLKVKKGDVMTMYATVKGIKGKDVRFEAPAVVHSARKGKTRWLLGVKTGKPSYIVKDGDYRVRIVDDAEAPPKVKK